MEIHPFLRQGGIKVVLEKGDVFLLGADEGHADSFEAPRHSPMIDLQGIDEDAIEIKKEEITGHETAPTH